MENLSETNIECKWIKEDDASDLLNISIKTLRNRCRKGELNHKIERKDKKYIYYIHTDSIPRIIKDNFDFNQIVENKEYSDVPGWAKIQADKYIRIIKYAKTLKGNELRNFISEWNIEYPELKTSYTSVNRMKKRYEMFGINGLLARYGKNINKSIVKEQFFEYFKRLYLLEGAPSAKSCWENTLGYAIRTANIKKEDFPSHTTFLRKLKKEIPAGTICMARYGKSAYNSKYGNYITRDYSTITCGSVWVSDHAQIDIAVKDEAGKPTFPWVTAWRDYKSGKWLGWLIECGSPNSDRIFQAFYYAVEKYGLPKDVIIDNGKDYRCKDFAGGRIKDLDAIKIENNKNKTTSMLDLLGVEVHFALPYNAQTKPIERDFLKIKERLSKHCIGYRGGNVVERPEKLIDEIKNDKILDFKQFKEIFNDFIINILNKANSDGMNHNGLSPDEVFDNEYDNKVRPCRDALKLFCMRTSKDYTIARNGIKDRKLGITYWADWMVSQMKSKVYLRRDPDNFKEAWVFRANDDTFLGFCTAVSAVAALHADKVSKEEFREAMAIKKRSFNLTKAYIENLEAVPIEEQCENYKAVFAKNQKTKKKQPKVSIIANTAMDKAIQKKKEMDSFGRNDLSMFIQEDKPQKEKLYLFETDRLIDEELKGVANGRY